MPNRVEMGSEEDVHRVVSEEADRIMAELTKWKAEGKGRGIIVFLVDDNDQRKFVGVDIRTLGVIVNEDFIPLNLAFLEWTERYDAQNRAFMEHMEGRDVHQKG